jgi:ABC-type nitrate/sulfonate/bicarbonate transport system permease component
MLKVRAIQLLALLVVFGAWAFYSGPGAASPLILPTISGVANQLWAFLGSSELWTAVWVTFKELFVALAIATTCGLAVGFWGARSPLRSQVLSPLLVWSYQVPMILFYPLFLLWLGFGTSSKIGYAAVSAFLPIAFNSLRAFASVDPKYVQMGRAFGASPRQLDLWIKFRAGLPLAAAGIKLGTAICMVTVIVAEMLGSSEGLGYLIKYYSESFNAAQTYAIIVIVLLVVGLFYAAVQRLLRDNLRARSR